MNHLDDVDVTVLKSLIQHGADVNARNKENFTALDAAADIGQLLFICVQTVENDISNTLQNFIVSLYFV